MSYLESRLLTKFARLGVLHREAVKNDLSALRRLVRAGFVQKVYKSGRVFYELTERALPLLESQRKKLLEEVAMRAHLDSRNKVYDALSKDVRFLDEKRPEAKAFLFLGDWQLHRPVVPSQLELAKLRFYQDHVPIRVRRAA